MSPHVELEFAALTDTGMVREHNEDSIACVADIGLAVLADGMGGHRGGEVASSMATAVIQHSLISQLNQRSMVSGFPKPKTVRGIVDRAIQQANSAIYDAGMQQAEYSGMGTTLVTALFHHDRLILANVGDSRAYRIRDNAMAQLTHDHSYLQEQIDAGYLSEDEARVSGNRNLVTRALGVSRTVNADIGEHHTAPGDIYLICSDGLSDMLTDIQILAEVSQPGTLTDVCERLVRQANLYGGHDNVSVILTRVINRADRPQLSSRILQWITS